MGGCCRTKGCGGGGGGGGGGDECGGVGGGGDGGDGTLEQIRSRAPSCLVFLFLLHPPVSFFSFLSFFQAFSFFVPYTFLCDFLSIFLLVWICSHYFSLIFLSAYCSHV